MAKKGEAPPPVSPLECSNLQHQATLVEVFLVCLQQPLKGSRSPTSATLKVWKLTVKSKKLGVCFWYLLAIWHWIFSCIWFWCSTWDQHKSQQFTSHRFRHQLCRFNGPESRLQVEPRAELQQLQQTMKPTELQSDAPRGRPPLAVQRPVMPPTSPQGPSSPSGIDNLGQQDADRRRPGGPRDSEDSFRSFFPIEPPHAIVDWYDSFERISLFGMFGRHFGTQTLRNPFKKLSTCWKALVSNLPQPLKMLHGEYEQNPFWYTHCTQMSRRRIYLRKKRFQSWLYLQEATWRNETRAGGTNCTEGTAEVGSQAARGSQSVWSREPSRESSTTSTSSGGVEFSGGKVRCDFLQIALLI